MKLCYIDIETTGLDPQIHDVWEIALILDDDEGSPTSYRWTFQPDFQLADPTALRMNRLYERADELPIAPDLARFWLDGHELDVPTTKQAMWHIAELTAGRHLVGANPAFDALRVEQLMRTFNVCPAWHYHLVDVEVLMLGFLAGRNRWPALKKCVGPTGWRSTDLADALGVKRRVNAHSALADAEWARDIYRACMTGAPA